MFNFKVRIVRYRHRLTRYKTGNSKKKGMFRNVCISQLFVVSAMKLKR